MEDVSWQEILERLLQATNSQNETALAARLGISSQSIYNAKSKKQIPPAWAFEVAKTFGVSSDWLFFGRGPKFPDAQPQTLPLDSDTEAHAENPYTRCAKLEAELEEERKERRTLTHENRRLYQDNATLLRENGELRAAIVRMEERKKRYEAVSELSEKLSEKI